VTGGAVQAACAQVREEVFARARTLLGEGIGLPAHGAAAPSALVLRDGQVRTEDGGHVADLVDLVDGSPVERTVEWRHRPTTPLDADGQGSVHVQWAFCAHRAVVDVDTELGLVKVVELAAAQDVGRAMHPRQVLGQIHGGTAQGLGLALMEEIQVVGGLVRNPSFTDYLIPTALDMPPMQVEVLELADPHAPYGLRGVGEPPTISSTPAIAAAVRAATGRPLRRVPIRPEHIVGP
jgi:CO/xanthine dehydrogenase Mo-binding subunit